MAGALDGIRILEFASYVSGPFAGMLLADLGAEVIKIELPGDGDPFRGWAIDGYSIAFGTFNRNKRSVTLDLKSPEGIAAARQLIAGADVLIENLRAGAMERLGLGYEALAKDHPRLIYCSVTGYGGLGPYRDRPGYDTTGQAFSGLLGMLHDREAPQTPGVALSDHLGGMVACYGILAALMARTHTGKGQRVETSLVEATMAFLGEGITNYLETGRVPTRAARGKRSQVFAFIAADGKPFIIHLSSPKKFWTGLLVTAGRPELAEDERFAKRDSRIENYDALHDILAPIFRTRDRAEWLAKLEAADVPCGPINALDEVFADPQIKALGMHQRLPHPTRGTVSVVRNPVRLSGTPVRMDSAAPELGADNAALLPKRAG